MPLSSESVSARCSARSWSRTEAEGTALMNPLGLASAEGAMNHIYIERERESAMINIHGVVIYNM